MLQSFQCRAEILAVHRLGQKAHRAGIERPATFFGGRNEMHRNGAGFGLRLQLLDDPPAVESGQHHVQQNARRPEALGQGQARFAIGRHQSALAAFAHRVEQDAGERGVIFHNENDAVAGSNLVSVVGHGGGWQRRHHGRADRVAAE